MILIGDEIFTKVGGYVLGNVITSLIAGFGTFLWMLAWGIPYPALLGLLIFLLDLIPVIGSTVGGAIVTLVALTVSIPVAIATLVFYVAYRLAEDYLLVPRIIGHTVKVPPLGGMVAIVLGGVADGHHRRADRDAGRRRDPAPAGGDHLPAPRQRLAPLPIERASASCCYPEKRVRS